jgi:hypothetical protein
MALAPSPALAYRPFDETDADIAKPREIELELGPLAAVRTRERTWLAPGFVFNLGISRRLELVVEDKNVVPVDSSAPAPTWQAATAILLKGLLREGSLQEDLGPSVAIEAGSLLPTLPARDGVGASLAIIVSQQWPAATIHTNAEIAVTRDHRSDALAGAIFEGPRAWRIRPVMETFYEREGRGATTLSGLAGAIWSINDGLSFDAAARAAREDAAALFELRLGMTWAFAI